LSPAHGLALLLLFAAPAPRAGATRVATTSADTAALEFHGFRAGAHLAELDALVRSLDGRLHCNGAKADRRVSECRASIEDPALGGPVNLWISTVDSIASVITISGSAAGARLDRWRDSVERRYGRVPASIQGSQSMMQWVRAGRMLRLTWRLERGERVASLSLVDGRVLDRWGRGRG
jgi:hypothetical protein